MIRSLILVPTLVLAQPLQPTDPLAKPDPAVESFEATLSVDTKPGGKRFQGVWLKRADGSKLLIEYRALGCWTAFEGKLVKVTGKHYSPPGQSVRADHFRVETLQMVDPAKAGAFVSVGPIQTIDGRFGLVEGGAGSKMEGSTWLVFSGGGTSYQIANPARIKSAAGGPAEAVARAVARSPFFVAHMPGPLLWLLDVTPKATESAP